MRIRRNQIRFCFAGLLELRGADVVLSPRLIENLSEMARRKIQRRKRVVGIWEEAVNAALGGRRLLNIVAL